MVTRAMIVVAAGAGSRFERDKMLALVGGVPMVGITVSRVRPHADRCVLVCRPDQVGPLGDLGLDIEIVTGGPSRTASEIAGLRALGHPPDLIGIHDGARPNIGASLLEQLFAAADEVGGAVPVVAITQPVVDRALRPVVGVLAAQTPQVFDGTLLLDRYAEASRVGFVGQDTHEVIARFGGADVAALPGDPDNIKVTYPPDLARVRPLPGPSGSGLP